VKPLALTMGDPSGIGPEIAVKAWALREKYSLPSFVYLGDADHLAAVAANLGVSHALQILDNPGDAAYVFARNLPVLHMPLAAAAPAGESTPENGGAIIAAIERAVALTLSGDTSSVVTNPIAKHVLAAARFPYPGHTEFLGALARRHGLPAAPVMMIAAPGLRVVPLTIHIPLSAVPAAISREAIIAAALSLAAALCDDFGVAEPRIAVAGLNPHAGENGAMGHEEQTIVAPAIAELVARGVRASGPHPADTLFHERARANYDAVLAMYHDQALIPIKTIAFDEGVNVTLGLPFIRTSPDHGTAFDIAGQGRANPSSLIAALKLAASMADARARRAAPR
jgi:4-hydroxythreonine-4-phosphate dehydrogenase